MTDKDKKPKVVENDDEFEEFRQEDWGPVEEGIKDPKLWDKSWDDDSVNDPIGQQLRVQIAQHLATAQQQQQQQQQETK